MTNKEVFIRAYDEVQLRGLSPKTVESYLGLKLFPKYFNDQLLKKWVKSRFVGTCCICWIPGTVRVSQCFQQCLAVYLRRCKGRNLNYQKTF